MARMREPTPVQLFLRVTETEAAAIDRLATQLSPQSLYQVSRAVSARHALLTGLRSLGLLSMDAEPAAVAVVPPPALAPAPVPAAPAPAQLEPVRAELEPELEDQPLPSLGHGVAGSLDSPRRRAAVRPAPPARPLKRTKKTVTKRRR
jgi:hypothetical protein